jgi:hypothetical protein
MKGLPATGEPPIFFTYGPKTNTEGIVVRFSNDQDKSEWVGNFLPDRYSLFALHNFKASNEFAIFAGGVLYIVDAASRKLNFGPVRFILRRRKLSGDATCLLLDNGGLITCLFKPDRNWRTYQFIAADFRELQHVNNCLIGYSLATNMKPSREVQLDLKTGELNFLA